MIRTSITDPIRINLLPPNGLTGRIGITLAPGKRGPSVSGPPWQRDLDIDLAAIRDLPAHVVVTLMEDHEFRLLGTPDLFDRVRAAGLESVWFPIRDLDAPSSIPATRALVDDLLARAAACQTMVIHCRGGQGRSGTIAACCLIGLGRGAADAIVETRRARPDAIEGRAQESFVAAFAAAWS